MSVAAVDVERYERDGAVPLRGAFGADVAAQCRSILWRATGCDEHDPSTWTRPVVRVDGRGDPPFVAAANTPRLHAAFDTLVGAGRWQPLRGIGTFPIRFPHTGDPGDAGWHIESTGADAEGRPVVEAPSPVRVLLLLFLFSDVGPDDAPTRIRLGSHRHALRRLAERGAASDFFEVSKQLVDDTAELPEGLATGAAGDVWLCHPQLVHAAQPHRGTRVRFMAQPPLPGVPRRATSG